MTVDNLDEFVGDLDKANDELEDEWFVDFHRRLVLRALAGIVIRTRVRTGRARGGYQTTLGRPARSDTGRIDPTGLFAQFRARGVLAKLKAFDVAWITNLVAYAIWLEIGTDKMAGDGMVRATFRELQDYAEQKGILLAEGFAR